MRPVVIGGACAGVAPPVSSTARVPGAPSEDPRAGLLRWLELVQQHVSGCADSAVVELATWSRSLLDGVIADVRRPSTFSDALDRLGHADGGRLLKRGAVLHADVAAFVRDGQSRVPVLVRDGRHIGSARGSVHWEIARQVLGIVPSAQEDAEVRLWYRAVSAHLLHQGLLDEAPGHLVRARELFPADPAFLLDSAYLHETFASPPIQEAAVDMRRRLIWTSVDAAGRELERAERYLRLALAAAPDNADARMRRGRILSALGRHRDAIVELRRAMRATRDMRVLYLSALFLGRAEQAIGRLEDAQQHFENAATLYPAAQSPWLALAQLARRRGDRAALEQSLAQAAAADRVESAFDDPRSLYFDPHLKGAPALMAKMREIAKQETP